MDLSELILDGGAQDVREYLMAVEQNVRRSLQGLLVSTFVRRNELRNPPGPNCPVCGDENNDALLLLKKDGSLNGVKLFHPLGRTCCVAMAPSSLMLQEIECPGPGVITTVGWSDECEPAIAIAKMFSFVRVIDRFTLTASACAGPGLSLTLEGLDEIDALLKQRWDEWKPSPLPDFILLAAPAEWTPDKAVAFEKMLDETLRSRPPLSTVRVQPMYQANAPANIQVDPKPEQRLAKRKAIEDKVSAFFTTTGYLESEKELRLKTLIAKAYIDAAEPHINRDNVRSEIAKELAKL